MPTRRARVERGVYRIGPCTCGVPKARHDVYEVCVGAGRDPLTGTYRQAWKRHHGTLTTARDVRRDLIAQARAHQLRRTTATVGDLFDRWLADLDQLGVAPKTISGYRRDAATYWKGLRDRPLHSVTRADVRAVLTAVRDRGSGTGHALSAISAAFTWAVQEEWLAAHEDPTKKIRRTAKINRLPKVPTPDAVRAVLAEARRFAAAGSHSSRPEMERFLFLGAVTGCRCSELRGVRIADIDLDRGYLGLVRAMSDEQEWTLKNRQERPVGLDDLTVDVVRAQVAHQHTRALNLGLRLRDDAFLFSDDPHGGDHWREAMVGRYVAGLFDHAARDPGPDCSHRLGDPCPRPGPLALFTFKHLRKFMSTYGKELGFGDTVVASRAGHDPAVARRHYTGVEAATDRRLSAGLAELIRPDIPMP